MQLGPSQAAPAASSLILGCSAATGHLHAHAPFWPVGRLICDSKGWWAAGARTWQYVRRWQLPGQHFVFIEERSCAGRGGQRQVWAAGVGLGVAAGGAHGLHWTGAGAHGGCCRIVLARLLPDRGRGSLGALCGLGFLPARDAITWTWPLHGARADQLPAAPQNAPQHQSASRQHACQRIR